MHPIVLAQRIAQKLTRVAPAACEAPPGPVIIAWPPSCNLDQRDHLQNFTDEYRRVPTLYEITYGVGKHYCTAYYTFRTAKNPICFLAYFQYYTKTIPPPPAGGHCTQVVRPAAPPIDDDDDDSTSAFVVTVARLRLVAMLGAWGAWKGTLVALETRAAAGGAGSPLLVGATSHEDAAVHGLTQGPAADRVQQSAVQEERP